MSFVSCYSVVTVADNLLCLLQLTMFNRGIKLGLDVYHKVQYTCFNVFCVLLQIQRVVLPNFHLIVLKYSHVTFYKTMMTMSDTLPYNLFMH